ncbi:MAG: MucB/RseB C-terminal domain-containing protein [Leptothrix sp. (in: b-proteobacteria)]
MSPPGEGRQATRDSGRMPRQGWPAALTPGLMALLLLLLAGALAPSTSQAGALDAGGVIQRIQSASNRQSYVGTFVISHPGGMSSLRITHVVEGSDQVDRIETLDGPLRQIYRHNDLVHVLWPRSRTASIEHRDLRTTLPTALPSTGLGRLDAYELQADGLDRVAGLEADVVRIRPRDGQRHGQRLWIERRTGLLLRTDLIGAQGEVIETAAFTELHLDAHPSARTLLAEMHRLKGYRIERPSAVSTELDREGWQLRMPVAGFRPIHTDRYAQGLGAHANTHAGTPAGAAAGTAASSAAPHAELERAPPAPAVLHSVFSDGLVTVSVFIEAYDPQRHRAEPLSAVAGDGATQVLGSRHGDWWITAVGDVPSATLQQFTASLERRKP